MTGGATESTPVHRRLTDLGFGALEGWAEDDHEAALAAFRVTCSDIALPDWAALAEEAEAIAPGQARAFFEARFRPLLVEDEAPALFTGYYEPELEGDLRWSERFPVPLYRRPEDLGDPGPTRAEIEDGALAGRGLEMAWVADPLEAFLLQVQGSGRIRLPDGRVLRLGHGGGNGHPYTSIGRVLVERGAVPADEVSVEAIRDWVMAHPVEGAALRRLNASFAFFRALDDLPAEAGPPGTMGRPVMAGRSVAVDPACVPLGLPVWIETGGGLRRLMVAQDTGSAIRGAQRADIFFGTGIEAGRQAGAVREGGRMVLLLPRPGAAGGPGPAGPT
ncbi:murein transglycosylase A [Rubellimicrobium roseum]|nr:MltA domain-containing protein [Rubellimicrobium roseum]